MDINALFLSWILNQEIYIQNDYISFTSFPLGAEFVRYVVAFVVTDMYGKYQELDTSKAIRTFFAIVNKEDIINFSKEEEETSEYHNYIATYKCDAELQSIVDFMRYLSLRGVQ